MINFGFLFKGSTCIAIINSKWYGSVHCHQLFVRMELMDNGWTTTTQCKGGGTIFDGREDDVSALSC